MATIVKEKDNTNQNLLLGDVELGEKPARKQTPLSKFITAVSNFSVQYNFQAISICLVLMSSSECTSTQSDCNDGTQKSWVTSSATATVFIGAILGQLTMGYLGDLLGRNLAMTLTLLCVAVGALGSAAFSYGDPSTVYTVIIVCRFFLGIGVGGVYPLSATKAAEDGGDHHGNLDPTSTSWAFFWQVPGTMVPWLLAYIFTYTSLSTSNRWRLILGLGAVPATMVVIGSVIESYHLVDASHPRGDQRSSVSSASKAVDTIERRHLSLLVHDMLKKKDTWYKLAVTGGGWFIYDVAYYGVNLFGGEILSSISSSDDDNVSSTHHIRTITSRELIAMSMGIPACILAIYSLKVVSIKTLQVWGFVFIAAMFILLACLFFPLKDKNSNALFAIYCFLLFSLSFGPNLSTFIFPAHTYPKEVRATFNGISAACGKLGAFAGVYMFGPIAEASSYPVVMVVCAVISILGAILTYVVAEE